MYVISHWLFSKFVSRLNNPKKKKEAIKAKKIALNKTNILQTAFWSTWQVHCGKIIFDLAPLDLDDKNGFRSSQSQFFFCLEEMTMQWQ